MTETLLVDTDRINEENYREIIKGIVEDLEEKGYKAYKQITEYLISGEIGYISSYKECRSRIQKIDRRDIIEYMLKEFIKWDHLEWIMAVQLLELV